MRRATLLVAAVACFGVGCGTFASVQSAKAEDRFTAGVRALAGGDFAAARSDLTWVAQNYGHEKEGQRALLVLAALETDPRNPNRRVDAGAELAASYLSLKKQDEWLQPIAQTVYLVALELGVAEQRAEETVQRDSARIKTVEQERDRLAKRVTSLEAQLVEKDRELQRIQKTIKP